MWYLNRLWEHAQQGSKLPDEWMHKHFAGPWSEAQLGTSGELVLYGGDGNWYWRSFTPGVGNTMGLEVSLWWRAAVYFDFLISMYSKSALLLLLGKKGVYLCIWMKMGSSESLHFFVWQQSDCVLSIIGATAIWSTSYGTLQILLTVSFKLSEHLTDSELQD